ncbi:MAG: AraC-like DNA-binding protein [Flammeovirgaceae bacterium]
MTSTDHFITYKPKAPELSGIIAYYYLHVCDEVDAEHRYVYYPHYRNAITCYLHSDVDLKIGLANVKPDASAGLTTLFSRNYNERILVSIKAPFTKLGVAFEPLGVQRFLNRKFSEVAVQTSVRFAELGEGFDELAQMVLSCPMEDPTSHLDRFFLENLQPNKAAEMERIVAHLFAEKEHSPLEELAREYGLSLRSLQRKFKDHLMCSPREYRRLIRFRSAVNTYQFAERQTSFTQLALEHNYYDQPAFIKHFKQIAGKSPRDFFNHIQQYGSEDTFWTKA